MFRPTEQAPASCAPRLAASIAPGPPPVMTLKPASPSARPMRRASAYSGWVTGVRAEPNTETAGGIAAMTRNPRSSSSPIRRMRSGSVRTAATAGVSALRSSSSEVAGARGSTTGGDDTDAAWTRARVDNLRTMADDERTPTEPDAQPADERGTSHAPPPVPTTRAGRAGGRGRHAGRGPARPQTASRRGGTPAERRHGADRPPTRRRRRESPPASHARARPSRRRPGEETGGDSRRRCGPAASRATRTRPVGPPPEQSPPRAAAGRAGGAAAGAGVRVARAVPPAASEASAATRRPATRLRPRAPTARRQARRPAVRGPRVHAGPRAPRQPREKGPLPFAQLRAAADSVLKGFGGRRALRDAFSVLGDKERADISRLVADDGEWRVRARNIAAGSLGAGRLGKALAAQQISMAEIEDLWAIVLSKEEAAARQARVRDARQRDERRVKRQAERRNSGDRVSRDELAKAQDGRVGAQVRIVIEEPRDKRGKKGATRDRRTRTRASRGRRRRTTC